jgi:UDP-glucose 4-epimerase
MSAAIANNVRRAIVLSTDKAAYPIDVLGLTKALIEKILVCKARIRDVNPVFCATR